MLEYRQRGDQLVSMTMAYKCVTILETVNLVITSLFQIINPHYFIYQSIKMSKFSGAPATSMHAQKAQFYGQITSY